MDRQWWHTRKQRGASVMSTVTTKAPVSQNIFATIPKHNSCASSLLFSLLFLLWAHCDSLKNHISAQEEPFLLYLFCKLPITLLGSEYNELTGIIRTLLFPSQTTKPSTFLAGKCPWGFNVGFTWVQIVEVQALDEHYGWKIVQLFCSINKKTQPRGICSLNRACQSSHIL